MSNVTTTAEPLGPGGFLVQNLGPDIVYVGGSDVDTTTGIELASGQAIYMGYMGDEDAVYAVSVGTSDVRTMSRALGLF